MNSLLTLAKDLEQKSKAQQQNTGEMLKAAFSEHEKSVKAELNESAKRISAAMLDHDRTQSSAMNQRTKGMLRMVSQTWLTIVLVSVLLTASSAGILWWQGQHILDNYMSIRKQKDALEKLNAKTWGVSFQNDSNGQFLVLPKGVKAETSWTLENAFAEWRTMSGLMQRENAALSEHVTDLSRQVQSLSEQLRRLS